MCVYWLLDECRLGAEQCVYAHDRTYLPTGGQWWEDAARNARVRAGMHAMCVAVPSGYWEVLLAEAAKPDPWHLDLWASGIYTPSAAAAGEKKTAVAAARGAKNGRKAKRDGNGRGLYAGTRRTRHEGDYEDMDDFYEEMMMQGIKPWDEDYSYVSAAPAVLVSVRRWLSTLTGSCVGRARVGSVLLVGRKDSLSLVVSDGLLFRTPIECLSRASTRCTMWRLRLTAFKDYLNVYLSYSPM